MAALLVALGYLWAGFVLAISFMEAPVKFRAPGLTRKVGLSVGVTVFSALNLVERVFAIATLVLVLLVQPDTFIIVLFTVVWVIIVLQTFWLRPMLNQRSAMIQRDETPPPSHAHRTYILTEIAKVALLLIATTLFLTQMTTT